MEKGWCWRAAERRANGQLAPEDPMQCLSPCPETTERAGAILGIVGIAHRQLRLGGMDGTPFGLDFNVVARLADDAGITTDPDWWRLVTVVEGELISVLRPAKTE